MNRSNKRPMVSSDNKTKGVLETKSARTTHKAETGLHVKPSQLPQTSPETPFRPRLSSAASHSSASSSSTSSSIFDSASTRVDTPYTPPRPETPDAANYFPGKKSRNEARSHNNATQKLSFTKKCLAGANIVTTEDLRSAIAVLGGASQSTSTPEKSHWAARQHTDGYPDFIAAFERMNVDDSPSLKKSKKRENKHDFATKSKPLAKAVDSLDLVHISEGVKEDGSLMGVSRKRSYPSVISISSDDEQDSSHPYDSEPELWDHDIEVSLSDEDDISKTNNSRNASRLKERSRATDFLTTKTSDNDSAPPQRGTIKKSSELITNSENTQADRPPIVRASSNNGKQRSRKASDGQPKTPASTPKSKKQHSKTNPSSSSLPAKSHKFESPLIEAIGEIPASLPANHTRDQNGKARETTGLDDAQIQKIQSQDSSSLTSEENRLSEDGCSEIPPKLDDYHDDAKTISDNAYKLKILTKIRRRDKERKLARKDSVDGKVKKSPKQTKPAKNEVKSSIHVDDGFIYIFKSNLDPANLKIGETDLESNKRILDWAHKCKENYVKVPDDNDRIFQHHKAVEKIIDAELYRERRKFLCVKCRIEHKLNFKKGTQHGEWFEITEERALEVVDRWRSWIVTQKPYNRDGTLTRRWRWKYDQAMAMNIVNWQEWTRFSWFETIRYSRYRFDEWAKGLAPELFHVILYPGVGAVFMAWPIYSLYGRSATLLMLFVYGIIWYLADGRSRR